MTEIIDLSQEIYTGMPVFTGHPDVRVTMHLPHERRDASDTETDLPSVNRLEFGEHTGTHVDALSHMAPQHHRKSIETMALSMFYTQGICLDLSHKRLRELIDPSDLETALASASLDVRPGDTVLIHTDHYRKAFGTADWDAGPGLSADAAQWLGGKQISAFGVETPSPGVRSISNRRVHEICGEFGFTHYENLLNLHRLTGRGRFRFVALPLKIRGGTGSPVRAAAVFE
jgi:kynurenine formamidase